MAGAMIGQLALPLLMEALREGLTRMDSPAAKGAADAIETFQTAVRSGAVSKEELAEANRHIEKLAEVEGTERASVLGEINASLRAEVASGDAYVRRMRPTFGYLMAITWTAQMLAVAWVIVMDTNQAGVVLQAMESLGTIWGVALSVLGIYVYQRSAEKKAGVSLRPPPVPAEKTVSGPERRYND